MNYKENASLLLQSIKKILAQRKHWVEKKKDDVLISFETMSQAADIFIL